LNSIVAAYGIVVGIMIFAMWVGNFARNQVPELVTRPWEIRTHVTAECLMAVTMLAGGISTLAGASFGEPLLLLGLGMTAYSIVNSSGYYLQRHQAPPVVMFGVLLVLTVAGTAGLMA
jgi:hypothetical protein